MSVEISYLFNSELTLPDLAKRINQSVGCSLIQSKDDDGVFVCELLGMDFSLCTQNYLENDGVCNFEDFGYIVGGKTWMPTSDLRVFQAELMAVLAYLLDRRLKINEGFLVFELQRPLARYGHKINPETNKLERYDSEFLEFVTFPDHFMKLYDRCGRDWRPT